MNWKEFFKPTLAKIILFIIMLIFLNPLSFHMSMIEIECVKYPCDWSKACTLPTFYSLLGKDFYIGCGLLPVSPRALMSAIQTIALFSPILEYLLACLIVFPFNKNRNRKR